MLHPLLELLPAVSDRIAAAGHIALFLDFDGTLVPIQSDPAAPMLDTDTAETLNAVARHEGIVTTIISGRAVEDLYERIRLGNVIYAGNHGLEILSRNLNFVEPVASARSAQLERLCDGLAAEVRGIAGAMVEYKGLTAAVHYRLAAETDIAEIRKVVHTSAARHGKFFRVSAGRKIFEILPRINWHKGAAVRWIVQHLGRTHTLVIYVGDDTSDEEAFRVLPRAITIKVGDAPETRARFRLPNPAAVHEFLSWLAGWGRARPQGA